MSANTTQSSVKSNGSTTAPQAIENSNAASFEVYRKLRNDIVAGRLKPNARLRFDSLKNEYDAGVGTLREALSHLVSDGLVRSEVGRGFSVAPISHSDLVDITYWRIEFERRALIDSIKNGDDDWEAEIVGAYHLLSRAGLPKFGASAEEWNAYGEKHRRFHDALVANCTSPWLLYFRGTLIAQARRYQALAVVRREPLVYRSEDEHEEIKDAVIARKQKLAADLIEKHIQTTADVVLEELSKSSEEEPIDTAKRPKKQTRKSAKKDKS